jgi:hypothetical protein
VWRKIPQPGSLYRTARHLILRAEEMQTLAEEANDPTVRRMMLRIAADYKWLADKADDRAAQDSIMFKRDAEYDPGRAALDSETEEQNGL